jgi:MFS family permease
VLAQPGFRVFYLGHATSLLGSAMSGIALTFAVLGNGGDAADLGYVFAAEVVPQVVFMVGGGVLADRLGRRPVMLATDVGRLAVQASLAGYAMLSSAVVLSLPAIRSVTWREPAAPPGSVFE